MSQDLRKLFGKEREQKFTMKKGHEDRFMERLNASFPKQRTRIVPNWSIAAAHLWRFEEGKVVAFIEVFDSAKAAAAAAG